MSTKLNDFMFEHNPEDVWLEIQKSCIQAADEWMSEHCDPSVSRNDIIHKIPARIHPIKDHPFFIYLRQNNIGEVKDWSFNGRIVYEIGVNEVIPKDNKHYDTGIVDLQLVITNTLERKVMQYGIGDCFD